MIDRLPCIAESIKITFAGPMSMSLIDKCKFENGSIEFDAYIVYEIIGSYLINNRVKTVVKIHQLQCSELAQDYALTIFQRNLQRLIVKRIPEATGHVDICIVEKLTNEE